jgi:hypothetical protein
LYQGLTNDFLEISSWSSATTDWQYLISNNCDTEEILSSGIQDLVVS